MTTDQSFSRALAAIVGGLALTLFLTPGVLRAQVADSDGDAIPDKIECPDGAFVDSDGDGLSDCQDADDDGDGVPTLEERGMDTDGDGVPNHLDDDDDGDGKPTRDEIFPPYPDVDGDLILDYLDADETDGPLADPDHDGLNNAEEERVGSDPRNADTDGDTVFDNEEINPNGSARDSDDDGEPDFADPDDDGDGIPTELEHDPGAFGANSPQNPVDEDNAWNDVDDDGIPNHLDLDSDGDGESDQEEFFGDLDLPPVIGMVPIEQTLDLHISDTVRVVVTEPALPDHDGDGIPNWLDSYDEDGPDGDADGDGISNAREESMGTNPYDDDSDGDWIADGDEHGDSDGDGVLNKLDPDDDNDGIPTSEEGQVDVDGDGVPNHLDLDSDGDGRPDSEDITPQGPCLGQDGSWWEIPDGSNLNSPCCVDRDCDGIADNQESTYTYYVSGDVHFFSRDENGDWHLVWTEPGHEVRPALFDGCCAMKDWDCDGIPNWEDADWTDGPCENNSDYPVCD
jgi:hypothetical protein